MTHAAKKAEVLPIAAYRRSGKRLTKRALDDLARSGLTESDARKLRIAPMPFFGPTDGYRIPYFALDGSPTDYYRDRLFDNPNQKYNQARKSTPRAYFPPLLEQSWKEVARDTSAPVLIVEGEKKAAAGCKAGFPTIGIGGVDSWSAKKRMIPDLAAFPWKGRPAVIVFDSDVVRNATVRAARDRLGAALREKGAGVVAVDLPDDGKNKVGLDDYLVARGPKALAKLLRDGASEANLGARGERPTDAGNARRFAHAFRGKFLWCPDRKKWLVWVGTHWKEDDVGRVMQGAKEVARGIYAEAADCDKEERRAQIARWATQTESEARLGAMINLARDEPGMFILAHQLDADRYLLGCPNGTLDLRTGKLRAARPEDYITKQAGVPFDPTAKCPQWEKFLAEIFPKKDVAAFVRRAMGYTLTGDTGEQCLFFEHGGGSNGKSTKQEIQKAIMGDYAMQVKTETLMASRPRDGGAASSDVAALDGARCAMTAEPEEGARLSEAFVKLVTGQEKLRARRLFAEEFEFTPELKIWLAANHKPKIRGTDYAIWRRIRLIPYEVTIPEAKKVRNLADRILRDEGPGVFAWMVRGCLEWQREGLKAPPAVRAATEAYRLDMDVVRQWVDSHCERGEAFSVQASWLWEEFTRWARTVGERSTNQTDFGRRMTEAGLDKQKVGGTVKYMGIRLKTVAGR